MTHRFPTSTITACVNEGLGTINYRTVRGSELRQNIKGLLRNFKVTKEREKDTEVLHLANLENGCIRKFIVKKVDEKELTPSIPTLKKSDDNKSMRDENENTALVGGLMEGDDQPLIENLLESQNSLDGSETSSDIEKKDNISSTTEDSEENNNDKNDKNIKISSLDNNILNNNDEKLSNLFKLEDFANDETVLIMPGDEKLEKEDPGVVNPVYLNEDDDFTKGDGSVGTTSDRSSPNLTPPESPMDSYRSNMGNQSHRSSISSVRKKGILKKTGSCSTLYGGMEMDNLSGSRCVSRNGSINMGKGGKEGYDDEVSQDDTNKFISADDEWACQQTTKSLGGHRVKFILETGRPDFVSGSYDDIGIEKMERERIDRIEKGKSLDVTNNENERGGRKCMIFLGLMFLLAGAIIIGALYGSGRLGKFKEFSKGIPAQQLPLPGTFVSTTPAPVYYVPNTLELKFELDSIKFTPALADHTSTDFKAVTNVLEDKIHNILKFKFDDYYTVKLIKFENSNSNSSSITVRIRWQLDEDDNIKIPTIKEVNEQFEQYFDVHDGYIGGHKLASKSLNIEKLVDECKTNRTLPPCSHNCNFQTITLLFKCSCPDQMILENDFVCIDRKTLKPTEKPKPVNLAAILEKARDSGGVVADIIYEKKEKQKPETTPRPNVTIEANITLPQPNVTTVSGLETTDMPMINITDSNNSTISTNLTSTAIEDIPGNNNSTGLRSVEDSDNEIDVDSNAVTSTEKGSNHKPPLDKKEESNLIPDTAPKKYSTITNTTEFLEDFISPGTRMEDIASFTNISVENAQNKTSLIYRDSPGDGRLHTNFSRDSFINEIIDDENSLRNISQNITNEIHSQDVVSDGQIIENNITMSLDNEPILDDGSSLRNTSKNITSEISSKEVVIDGQIIENNSTMTMDNDKNITNEVSSEEVVIDSQIIENNSTMTMDNETINITHPILTDNMTSFNISTGINSNENVDVNKNNEITLLNNDTIIIDEAFNPEEEIKTDNVLNETAHNPANEITEVNTTKVSASNIDDEIKSNITNLTSTLKPLKEVTINNVTNENSDNHLTNKTVEEIEKTVVIVTSTPYYDPNQANKSPPKYPNKTSTPPISTPQPVLSNVDTNEPMQSEMNQTQLLPVDPNITIKNESYNSDNSTIMTKSDVMGSDTGNNLSISNELNTTKNTDDQSLNITKPVFTIPELNATEKFRNKSHILFATNGDVETSTILSIIPSTSFRTPCAEGMIPCINETSKSGHQCILKSSRCNGIIDCNNSTDELNCQENDCYENFMCKSGECLDRTLVCNSIPNCPDGDDEIECESWSCNSEEFHCNNTSISKCIPISLKCDGNPDCADHEDEVECHTKCSKNEYFCPEGWCIPNTYICDGHPHCLNGEDENDCKCSGEDETECNVGGCVSTFRLCDGNRNCADGSDEWNCLRIENTTQRLEVRKEKSHWMAVCGDDWTHEWSVRACQQLGGVVTHKTTVQILDDDEIPPSFAKLDSSVIAPAVPMQFALRDYEECTSGTVVQLSCEYPNTCSSRGNESSNRTARLKGDYVKDGELPSLVKLVRHRKPNEPHLCTATVVAPTWVLTSYSCISANGETKNPNEWSVIAGDSSPQLGEEGTQTRNVHRIRPYPGSIRIGGKWRGDAVLLQLKTPLVINKKISPACLSDMSPTPADQCIIVSWSSKQNTQQSKGIERHLQYLPLEIIKSDTCNATHYPSHNVDLHMCADINYTEENNCNEESGSPMMCWDSNNGLLLHGILSDHGNCGKIKQPSVFTAVHKLEPWLSSTIGIPLRPSILPLPETTTKGTPIPTTTPAGAVFTAPTGAVNTNEVISKVVNETDTQMEPLRPTTSKPTIVHNNDSNDTFAMKLTSEESIL